MPAFAPFSDEDFETLGNWLVRRTKGISDIVELEGFVTAIVIGPNTLSPLAWLPKVWGGKQPSEFKDLDELNRFVALVMGFYNSIVAVFEATPSMFAPTFYESKAKDKRSFIVDGWCVGFVKGMRMDATGWTLLKRERPDLLRPIKLFGTRGGWHDCKLAVRSKCTLRGRRALHPRCVTSTRSGYRTGRRPWRRVRNARTEITHLGASLAYR